MRMPFLPIALATCVIAGQEQDPAAVLRRADEAFCRDTRERGLEGWLDWFASDAVVLPPQGPVVSGIEAIRRYYGSLPFPPPGFSWKPEAAGLAEGGDLGYSLGSWEVRGATATGEEKVERGRYLTVWRRQPDGSYKVLADAGGAADFRRRVEGLDGPPLAWSFESVRTEPAASGDMAFTVGTWTAGTDEVERGGKFLTVWKRSGEDAWEVAAEIGFAH